MAQDNSGEWRCDLCFSGWGSPFFFLVFFLFLFSFSYYRGPADGGWAVQTPFGHQIATPVLILRVPVPSPKYNWGSGWDASPPPFGSPLGLKQ